MMDKEPAKEYSFLVFGLLVIRSTPLRAWLSEVDGAIRVQVRCRAGPTPKTRSSTHCIGISLRESGVGSFLLKCNDPGVGSRV